MSNKTILLTVCRFSDNPAELNCPIYLCAVSLLEEYHGMLQTGEGLSDKAALLQIKGTDVWDSLTPQEQNAVVLRHNDLLQLVIDDNEKNGPKTPRVQVRLELLQEGLLDDEIEVIFGPEDE